VIHKDANMRAIVAERYMKSIEWAPQIRHVLQSVFQPAIWIQDAETEEDRHDLFDYRIFHNLDEIGTIAARCYENTYRTQLLTLNRTEVVKIKKGLGDLYINCWGVTDTTFREWCIWDINALTRAAFWDDLSAYPIVKASTRDGQQSDYIKIPPADIKEHGALIAQHARNESQTRKLTDRCPA